MESRGKKNGRGDAVREKEGPLSPSPPLLSARSARPYKNITPTRGPGGRTHARSRTAPLHSSDILSGPYSRSSCPRQSASEHGPSKWALALAPTDSTDPLSPRARSLPLSHPVADRLRRLSCRRAPTPRPRILSEDVPATLSGKLSR
jgi:hypothetical protein